MPLPAPNWIEPQHSRMLQILAANRGPLLGEERDFVLQGVLQGCFAHKYKPDAEVCVDVLSVSPV